MQSLANPNYLYYLAKHGYFKRDEFKNYLKYLMYWKQPEYLKFIKYPECLYFLDLLQSHGIYESVNSTDCISFICEQQLLNWQVYQRKRQNCLELCEANTIEATISATTLALPQQIAAIQLPSSSIQTKIDVESKMTDKKNVFPLNRSDEKMLNKPDKKLSKYSK